MYLLSQDKTTSTCNLLSLSRIPLFVMRARSTVLVGGTDILQFQQYNVLEG
jgi:hypothetical protein